MNLKTIHLFPFVCHSNTHGKNKSTLVSSKNVRGTGGCYRRVARIFRWGGGGGVRFENERIQTCRGEGSGGMLPREHFRNFEMPWTTFHAFSWWRKRERECRVATRFFFIRTIL